MMTSYLGAPEPFNASNNEWQLYVQWFEHFILANKITASRKYVTVLPKTHLIRTKTEFHFIAAVYRHTQISIPSISTVKC